MLSFARVFGLGTLLLSLFKESNAAAILEKRGGRTSPPSGALVVRQSGTKSGEYNTISKAVAALGTGTASKTIFIYPGTYKEQVYITYAGPLTVLGSTEDTSSYAKNTVTISAGKDAKAAGSNDASGTLRVRKDNFALYNVNVENTFGKGSQAIALSAYGSQQAYYGVKLTGYQDTLLTNIGTQFYGKSYISGATDFIFGQLSVAWFDGVSIAAVDPGYITANGRDSATNPSIYVFNKCNVASGGAAAGKVYLGRPWRNYSRVIFQYTSLSNVINAAGWSIWNSGDERTDKVTYAEYKNTGAGAATSGRASFGSQLSSPYTISGVLGSSYTNWVDPNYLS